MALFGIVEIGLNSFLEPVIYGKTTGISALGLLVAAMFWTWLWGTLGLLLSTPLTVCMAVLGKYVPSLWFFATLLGEEAELEPDVRLYQRLVALDREKAFEVVEKELRTGPASRSSIRSWFRPWRGRNATWRGASWATRSENSCGRSSARSSIK